MSNRLFQGVIHQMRDAIDRTIGVIDETSVIIACSELGRIGEVNDSVTAETMASPNPFVINGYTYRSFGNRPRPEPGEPGPRHRRAGPALPHFQS